MRTSALDRGALDRGGPALSDHVRRLAVWVAVSALLVVFVVVVAREIVATFDDRVTTATDDEYVLFATSITGLVGGVFAVAVGAVPQRRSVRERSDADQWRARLATAYVLAYAAAGVSATVVCVARLGSATPLLQSLAGAFLGASAAAASAYFGIERVAER